MTFVPPLEAMVRDYVATLRAVPPDGAAPAAVGAAGDRLAHPPSRGPERGGPRRLSGDSPGMRATALSLAWRSLRDKGSRPVRWRMVREAGMVAAVR